VSDVTWLFVALAVVWVGIGGYLMALGARQRRIERRIDELTSR
jgi:CcmD family protein